MFADDTTLLGKGRNLDELITKRDGSSVTCYNLMSLKPSYNSAVSVKYNFIDPLIFMPVLS